MDKDNPGSFIPDSSTGHVFSSDGPIVSHVLEAPGTAPPTNGSPAEPVKRRPGRPKGSSKKNLLGAPPPLPKIKRPVGRPRKDGLPAGSVGPERAKVKRNPHTWAAHQGVEYPPVDMFVPGGPLSSHTMTFHTDPNMEMDDWAELARDKPDVLLVILLTALAAPNPAPSVGSTAEEAFRSHLTSLAHTSQQLQSIPSLYSVLKTFWLPSSPAYFSLTASTSTARTPSEHRFLYWDPHPLVFNGISCPACSQPLANQGRITSGPVKIYDIERPFFIIGCEYVCKSSQCTTTAGPDGRKFASTDASIFLSLPSKLRDEFPARLMYGNTDVGSSPNIWNWQVAGVSNLLWNLVRASLKSGLKKEVILHLIYSIQHSVSDDGPRSSSGAPARTTTTNDGMDDSDAEGAKHDVQPGDDEEAASGTPNHVCSFSAANWETADAHSRLEFWRRVQCCVEGKHSRGGIGALTGVCRCCYSSRSAASLLFVSAPTFCVICFLSTAFHECCQDAQPQRWLHLCAS